MIGKRGANQPLPRNCKRRGRGHTPLENYSGKAAEADDARSQETGPARTSEGKTMLLLSRKFASISLLLVLTGIAFSLPEITVQGTVSDPTGAVVINAKVELIENNIVAATVMTDFRGRYGFNRDVTAKTRLRVSCPGFG